MKNSNFLIIRLSSIGDIVLTSPLVRCLKSSWQNCRITFVVDKRFCEILENNPHIDELIFYDKTLSQKQNKFIDKKLLTSYKIIDLQNNFRSVKFYKSLAVKNNEIAKLDKHRLEKLAMIYLKKLPKVTIPMPLRYLASAEKFGVKYDEKGLEFWLAEEKNLGFYPPEKREFSINFSKKIKQIAIAPGANHFTKRWVPEYFVGLINLLHKKYNCEFLLLGGTEDNEICNKIKSLAGKNYDIFVENAANQTSLSATARLLDTCDLIVTNDTGIMHIAAARRLHVAAIFGATVPELGFSPFGIANCINSVDLKCRPCSHIGGKKCPKKHFDCMKKLLPEIVFENILNFVE